jgi:hypothetical protein
MDAASMYASRRGRAWAVDKCRRERYGLSCTSDRFLARQRPLTMAVQPPRTSRQVCFRLDAHCPVDCCHCPTFLVPGSLKYPRIHAGTRRTAHVPLPTAGTKYTPVPADLPMHPPTAFRMP